MHAETEEEHTKIVIEVLERARANNIKFNKNKFQYMLKEIKYLEHRFSEGKIQPDNIRITAIQNYDQPKNKKDLQRFLGLINYLRNFMPNVAEITSPLRHLIKKNAEFIWNGTHRESVQMLKNIITSEPVLQNFNPNLKSTIQTDSSMNGIGCVLLQNGKPVCYASKILSSVECNYGQIDKRVSSNFVRLY